MNNRGDDAFVARMREVHPEIEYTGKICNPPKIKGFSVSNGVLEPVINRDVLLVTSDDKIRRTAILRNRISRGFSSRVIEVVAAVSEMSKKELRGDSRLKHVVYWRHIAMYVIRKHSQNSFPFIGRIFKRDHATVMHGCRRVGQDFERYRSDVEKVESFL